jgi:hypothetical protein
MWLWRKDIVLRNVDWLVWCRGSSPALWRFIALRCVLSMIHEGGVGVRCISIWPVNCRLRLVYRVELLQRRCRLHLHLHLLLLLLRLAEDGHVLPRACDPCCSVLGQPNSLDFTTTSSSSIDDNEIGEKIVVLKEGRTFFIEIGAPLVVTVLVVMLPRGLQADDASDSSVTPPQSLFRAPLLNSVLGSSEPAL